MPNLSRCKSPGGCETATIIGLFLITVMLGHLGCAANPGKTGAGSSISRIDSMSASEEIKKQLGTIGVTPTQVESVIKPMDISTVPKWALEGDVEGPSLPVWCGFPIPGKAIVCLPMAAVSLISAATSDVKETLQESEKEINEIFSTEPLTNTIAEQLLAVLSSHRADAIRIKSSRAPGPQTVRQVTDTLLESKVVDVRLSFVPTKGPMHFQLLLTVRAKLRRQSDGLELSSYNVTYKSPERSLSAWTNNDGEVFRAELHIGAKRVAEESVDFLVLEYPAQIEPLMPQNGLAVRSLQPTLGWNPSLDQDQISQGVRLRIQRVTFDLRVSQAGAIVYERSGLTKALHKVETSLPSCTDHGWRVKARFQLDDRIRVSRWSRSQSFKTPC